MSEKPIILYAHEVRRLIDTGHVLVVRPIKPQPHSELFWVETPEGFAAWVDPLLNLEEGRHRLCPLGFPGDRLWVRETWNYITKAKNEYSTHRRPDGCPVEMLYYADAVKDQWEDQCRWNSPVAMPRWASRLTVEVERVEVKRLGYDIGVLVEFADWWTAKYGKRYPLDANPWAWLAWVKKVES